MIWLVYRLTGSAWLLGVTGFAGQIAVFSGGADTLGFLISFFTMSFLGMRPLGSLAAGALASWIGAPHTLAVGGLCSVIGACVLWRKLPVVRAHIRPIYARLGISRE